MRSRDHSSSTAVDPPVETVERLEAAGCSRLLETVTEETGGGGAVIQANGEPAGSAYLSTDGDLIRVVIDPAGE